MKTTKTTAKTSKKNNVVTPNFDPKKGTGKIYARLVKAGNAGITKEALYKGIEKAFNRFAWVKIFGAKTGAFRVANLKSGKVRLVLAANDTKKKAA